MMKKLRGFLLCIIVVTIIGCDAEDGSVNKAEVKKNYVELAKEFEEEYLDKTYILSKSQNDQDSLLISEQRLKEIKNKNGFNNQKIAAFRDSVYLIAQEYGIPREDVNLDEYFYIDHINGEIRSTDFFHKMFAYIKQSKKQAQEQQDRLDKLERTYIPKIKQVKDSAKAQKLIEEYRKKKEEIKNTN